MFLERVNLTELAGTVSAAPVLGGIVMWIRKSGAKKAKEEARLQALEDRQAATDRAVTDLASSQKELRHALDHQTEALSGRLDKLVDIMLQGVGR